MSAKIHAFNNNIDMAYVRIAADERGLIWHDCDDGLLVGQWLFWLDGGELYATDQGQTAECYHLPGECALDELMGKIKGGD